MSFEGMRICNFVRRDGRKCKAPAMKESVKCKNHGGALARAARTHGLYAKYQPARLLDMVEDHLNDSRLLDLRQQIALVSALLADSMDRIRKRQGKVKRNNLTTAEKRELVVLSEKMSASIERYAKVGIVLKSLIPVDTIVEVLAARGRRGFFQATFR